MTFFGKVINGKPSVIIVNKGKSRHMSLIAFIEANK